MDVLFTFEPIIYRIGVMVTVLMKVATVRKGGMSVLIWRNNTGRLSEGMLCSLAYLSAWVIISDLFNYITSYGRDN